MKHAKDCPHLVRFFELHPAIGITLEDVASVFLETPPVEDDGTWYWLVSLSDGTFSQIEWDAYTGGAMQRIPQPALISRGLTVKEHRKATGENI